MGYGQGMTTSVTITGSGTPIPSPDRAGPGVLVQCGDVNLQFDAGRSTLMRLAAMGVWPGQLDGVFVTHHHSDHLTGLQDLVLSRWVMDRAGGNLPMPVVLPAGPAERFVDKMLDAWEEDVAVRVEHNHRATKPQVNVTAFELPTVLTEVWSIGDVRVSAMQVRHEPVSHAVGYRVDSPDGSIAISGDTLVCGEVAELAAGADVLVYEAMRFEAIQALPEARQFILDYHADTRLIGAQAKEAGVGKLILTHLIPAPLTEEDEQLFVQDVRAGGFEGEIVVAKDLDTLTLG